MGTATITFTDTEDGKVQTSVEFDRPVDESDANQNIPDSYLVCLNALKYVNEELFDGEINWWLEKKEKENV